MELQLQIFLIIGVGGFLIAALILSNSLLIHYVVKLTKKISGKNDGSFPESLADPAEQANTYNNPAINLNDELNRRFTQYTPEPTMQRETQKIQSNKDSNSSQTIKNVIDVSEEFRWRADRGIRSDGNIESSHEGRTSFNEREYN